MSDFLSNFDKKNYKETVEKKKKPSSETAEKAPDNNPSIAAKAQSTHCREAANKQPAAEALETELPDDIGEAAANQHASNETDSREEVIEIDPDYQKKKRKKQLLMTAGIAFGLIVVYAVYFAATRVDMPDFVKKQASEARQWAAANSMTLDIKQAYSVKGEVNDVLKQSVPAGKKVKKGTTITFTISNGADPDEQLPLPDFSKMTQSQAEDWIAKHKAENLTLIGEYNDQIEKGKFIRLDIANKEVSAEKYRRQDNANLYYSKGKEVFEKNISVPDFVGKAKTEVETWAKKNEIEMTYEEQDSDKVEAGMILAQGIKKDEKIAKRDKMTVTVSLGKAVIVPNFAEMNSADAATAVEGLTVHVKNVFSDSVAYGQLISQSVEAGKKLTDKDNKLVKVVYSEGQPYIRSYIGQLEGDIPKLIYDNFNSKGANVTFSVYYVDSSQERGAIVNMSVYNQYIYLDTHITFAISNGSHAGLPSGNTSSSQETDFQQ